MKFHSQQYLPTERPQTGLLFEVNARELLDAAQERGYEVRRWNVENGSSCCGIFRVSKNGPWRAIGQFWSINPSRQCVIYRCCQPLN